MLYDNKYPNHSPCDCAVFNLRIKTLVGHHLNTRLAKPDHQRYLEIYKMTNEFDRHIANRYDGLSGSRYFMTVVNLYCDGVLKDEALTLRCSNSVGDQAVTVVAIFLATYPL